MILVDIKSHPRAAFLARVCAGLLASYFKVREPLRALATHQEGKQVQLQNDAMRQAPAWPKRLRIRPHIEPIKRSSSHQINGAFIPPCSGKHHNQNRLGRKPQAPHLLFPYSSSSRSAGSPCGLSAKVKIIPQKSPFCLSLIFA